MGSSFVVSYRRWKLTFFYAEYSIVHIYAEQRLTAEYGTTKKSITWKKQVDKFPEKGTIISMLLKIMMTMVHTTHTHTHRDHMRPVYKIVVREKKIRSNHANWILKKNRWPTRCHQFLVRPTWLFLVNTLKAFHFVIILCWPLLYLCFHQFLMD